MKYNSITVSWLFETELTNMNAGEGSSNLKELKTYNNGLPYISGQSMRHALKQAMMRDHLENFKCTPEFPCGDVKNCWGCDLFGYLSPGNSKRWSPIKASPALGQIRFPITTDLIFRMVEDIECKECGKKFYPVSSAKVTNDKTTLTCSYCGDKFDVPYEIRQALAHKQLIKNLYKSSVSIDLRNIGLVLAPNILDDKMDGFESITDISTNLRIERAIAILNGIYNLSDFANQSREMVNASPDFVVIGLQENYNHRLASVFKLNEEGYLDTNVLHSVINDALENNAKIFVGFISGIIKNEDEVVKILESFGNDINFSKKGPKDVFKQVITVLNGENNESS